MSFSKNKSRLSLKRKTIFFLVLLLTSVNIAQAATIGGTVWTDSDKDGIQDTGEISAGGIDGVTVKLYNALSTTVASAQVGSTTTNSTGAYSFSSVSTGSYYIKFSRVDQHSFSPRSVGGDNTKDSNPGAAGKTPIFKVVTANDFTIDAGMYTGLNTFVAPDETAPGKNRNAPLNTSENNQVKEGGLAVGALTSFAPAVLGKDVVIAATSCDANKDGAVSFDETTGQLYLCTDNGGVAGGPGGSLWSLTPDGLSIYRGLLTGNVGIGVELPTSKLDVLGNAKIEGAISVGTLSDRLSLNANPFEINITPTIGGTISPAKRLYFDKSSDRWNFADDLNIQGDIYKGGVLFTGSGGKFTDGTDPQDAVYISGNVGINTLTPTADLEVVGFTKHRSTATTGQPTLVSNTNSAGDALELKYTEQVNGTIPADIWQFRAGGVARPVAFSNYDSTPTLFLDSNSRVGIGNTNPTEKLEVTGKILSDEGVANGRAYLAHNGLFITNLTDGTYTSSITANGSNTYTAKDHHIFRSNGQERVRLTLGGDVGIGTINPGAKFEVASGNTRLSKYIQLNDYDDSNYTKPVSLIARDGNLVAWDGGLVVGRPTNGSIGDISDGNLYVQNNIGIGVSNPSLKLEVAGDIRLSSTSPYAYLDETDVPTHGRFNIAQSVGNTYFQTRDSNNTFISTDYYIGKNASGANLHSWRIANSEKLKVNSSGNTEILGALFLGGVSNPNTKLYFNTNSTRNYFAPRLADNTNWDWNNEFGFNRTNGEWYFDSPVAGATPTAANHLATKSYVDSQSGGGGGGKFVDGTNANDAVYTTGNVGIGTTSPSGRLHIAQDTGQGSGVVIDAIGTQNPNFNFAESGTNKWNFGYDLTGNYFKIAESGVGDRFVIKETSGNVGIGTTAPVTKLQIKDGTNRNLQLRGGLEDATAFALNAANDADTANIPLEFNASKFNFRVGNVGIGIAAPGAKLDIYEPAGDNVFALKVSGLNKWISTIPKLGDSGYNNISANGDTGLIFSNNNNSTVNIGGLVIAPHSTVTGGIKIQENGNVGVGVKTPGYKLDVAGDIHTNNEIIYGEGDSNMLTRNNITTRIPRSGFYQTGTATTAEGWPENASWYHLLNLQHSNTGNNYAMQLAADFYSNKLYYRSTAGSGATAWTELTNQGGGSSVWSLNGSTAYYLAGNVGIGGTSGAVIDLAIGDSDTGLEQKSDGVLAIYTNNQERMRIDTAGRVGINKINPNIVYDLDVGGIIRATTLRADSNIIAGGEIFSSNYSKKTFSASSGFTTSISESDIENACGDVDGCEMRLSMHNYNVGGNAPASRTRHMYYNNGNNIWRTSTDAEAVNGNNVRNDVFSSWDCVFSDADNGTLLDSGSNFSIIAAAGSYSSETCYITIID